MNRSTQNYLGVVGILTMVVALAVYFLTKDALQAGLYAGLGVILLVLFGFGRARNRQR